MTDAAPTEMLSIEQIDFIDKYGATALPYESRVKQTRQLCAMARRSARSEAAGKELALSADKLEKWREVARRDDWHYEIVGSDMRQLVEQSIQAIAFRSKLSDVEAENARLKAHAIKYIDPILGSDKEKKDAEDWLDNRLARHGEGHHALVGIYPCDIGMLLNALKSYRINLFKAEASLREVTRERDLAIAHDTQPYPTAFAYEQACKVLAETKERLREVTAERDRLVDCTNHAVTELTRSALSEDFDSSDCMDCVERIQNTLEPMGRTTDWHQMAMIYDRLCKACGVSNEDEINIMPLVEQKLSELTAANHRAETAWERAKEACAKVCDERARIEVDCMTPNVVYRTQRARGAELCAMDIRELKEPANGNG